MKNKILSLAKFFLGWPISFVALFFIYNTFAAHSDALFTINHANLFILSLSVICFLLYFLLRSIFWQKLLSYKGHIYPLKQSAYLWSIAELQRFVPGNIWSFVGRTHHFSQKGEEKKILLGSLTQEIVFLLTSCLILSLLCLNFLVYGLLPRNSFDHLLPLAGISVVVLEVMGMLWLFKHGVKNVRLSKFFPQLSFTQNGVLLFVMTLSFFFFGLGTYFSIYSFTSLYLYHIVPLIGFFTFAYVVGYLSLITPMGLGAREGVMILGLSKYLLVPQAVIAAFFARLMTIISELFFLGASYLWYKTKGEWMRKIEDWLHTYRYPLLLCIAIAIYIGYFSFASVYRYNNYYTGRFDLGNMDQTVWNTLHGRIFQLTDPDGTTIISRLAFHADFLLVFLAPFYLVWQDPRTLLILQTVVLAFGAVFVYLIAREKLKRESFAVLFGILFLLNPAVEYTNLYDFHAVTLATTLLLGAWFFLTRKKWFWYVLFFLLAALTKEEIWLIGVLFGIYTAIFQKKKILGATLAGLCAFMFYFLIWKAIPLTRGGNHFALSYYSDFGASPTGVVKNILLSPLKILELLIKGGRPVYLFQLLLPLGFLPLLFFPILFFAGPDLAVNLLSSNAQLHELYYQYTAAITPFLFIAAIYAVAVIKKYSSVAYRFVPICMIFAAVLGAYFYGPLPGAKHPNITMFTEPLENKATIDAFINSIPHQYSVAASNNVGSHLSHRQKIYTIPVGLKEADIVVFLLNDEFAQPSLQAQKKMAAQLGQAPAYTLLFEQGPLVVFKKTSVPTYTKHKSKALLPLFKGN